jgi:hypothetical protein
VHLKEIEPCCMRRMARDPAVEVATRLQALRYGFREELGRAAHARWDESALRPNETYVSNAIQKASRSNASASAAGLASRITRPCTSAWALVAGIPTRRPTAWAAASAAKTTRRLPSRPTRISGVSGGGAVSPAFRLTRSVDKVGRKTEMTRGIARLQFEIRALAGAAADQFHQPAWPADTRDRKRG